LAGNGRSPQSLGYVDLVGGINDRRDLGIAMLRAIEIVRIQRVADLLKCLRKRTAACAAGDDLSVSQALFAASRSPDCNAWASWLKAYR